MVHVTCLRGRLPNASRATSVTRGQPWNTRMVMRGHLSTRARMPSSVTFRQWLTFSSFSTLAHWPTDRAPRPCVVTCEGADRLKMVR